MPAPEPRDSGLGRTAGGRDASGFVSCKVVEVFELCAGIGRWQARPASGESGERTMRPGAALWLGAGGLALALPLLLALALAPAPALAAARRLDQDFEFDDDKVPTRLPERSLNGLLDGPAMVDGSKGLVREMFSDTLTDSMSFSFNSSRCDLHKSRTTKKL
ncbi:hypothetical protein ACJJTC_009386 [Scirpophaga incertulas]